MVYLFATFFVLGEFFRVGWGGGEGGLENLDVLHF